jgi:lipoprotein-releasing system permease protein
MFSLAVRHLLSRKKQTILILLGISLGTMMFILIAGVQGGMQEYVLDQLLRNTPHVTVEPRDEAIDPQQMRTALFPQESGMVNWVVPPSGRRGEGRIEYPQGWYDRLEGDPQVLGFSPGLIVSAIFTRAVVQEPAQFYGVLSEEYIHMTDMEENMREGSFLDLAPGGNGLILGSGLMETLGTRTGETITVTVGDRLSATFRVEGYFHTGMSEVDDALVYGALSDVQRVNQTIGEVGLIAINLHEPERAREAADRWNVMTRDRVESWQQRSQNFLQIFTIQNVSRLIITAAILIVASFGIYNVLSIMVSQKRQEIAILRSVGYPPSDILLLFLIQGILLGIVGASFGLILGHLLNLYVGSIQFEVDALIGGRLQISYSIWNYITGFALALISAVLASFLPARSASRLTPLDIIRSET